MPNTKTKQARYQSGRQVKVIFSKEFEPLRDWLKARYPCDMGDGKRLLLAAQELMEGEQ